MAVSSTRFVVASLVSSVIFAQGAIELAATVVAESTTTSTRLFGYETVQLTDAIAQRASTNFETSPLSKSINFDRGSDLEDATCKTFPGDQDWPTSEEWNQFDQLLGGALISTVPVAAPCYDSEWGPKDLKKCNEVVSKFGMPPLQ